MDDFIINHPEHLPVFAAGCGPVTTPILEHTPTAPAPTASPAALPLALAATAAQGPADEGLLPSTDARHREAFDEARRIYNEERVYNEDRRDGLDADAQLHASLCDSSFKQCISKCLGPKQYDTPIL